jgi:hypothetical protein
MIGYDGVSMTAAADLLLFDRSDELVALVDTDSVHGRTAQWAAEFRRGRLRRARMVVPFHLLITSDRLFLWNDAATIPPTLTVRTEPLLEGYFAQLGVSPESVRQRTFQDIVYMWLVDLMWLRPGTPIPPELAWAADCGFLASINDGLVRSANLAA